MSFFIDNLQYYLQVLLCRPSPQARRCFSCSPLQVDVLDSQYARLMTTIAATRAYDSLQAAHREYISTVVSQSFLTMTPVREGQQRRVKQYGKLTPIAGGTNIVAACPPVQRILRLGFTRAACFRTGIRARYSGASTSEKTDACSEKQKRGLTHEPPVFWQAHAAALPGALKRQDA